jgi:hypothetical protein
MIVDDDESFETIHIPAYVRKINELKKQHQKWSHHRFNIVHLLSMDDAMKSLTSKDTCTDALLVDYRFLNDSSFSNGADFVKYVRDNVNRQCQIVFFTMHGVSTIPHNELVSLINSNVFKFLDKSVSPETIANTLFDACTVMSPVVESLERFFLKYSTVLEKNCYTLHGEDSTFEEVITHIRMDDEKGRTFVEKLLQKAILLETDLKDC